jgi:hypothetical protein
MERSIMASLKVLCVCAALGLAAVAFGQGRENRIYKAAVSSGAVWLDEPVQDRAEAIARLQDLVIENLDAARPGIRRYYRLAQIEPATR